MVMLRRAGYAWRVEFLIRASTMAATEASPAPQPTSKWLPPMEPTRALYRNLFASRAYERSLSQGAALGSDRRNPTCSLSRPSRRSRKRRPLSRWHRHGRATGRQTRFEILVAFKATRSSLTAPSQEIRRQLCKSPGALGPVRIAGAYCVPDRLARQVLKRSKQLVRVQE